MLTVSLRAGVALDEEGIWNFLSNEYPMLMPPCRAGRNDPGAGSPKSRRNQLQPSRPGQLDLPKLLDVRILPAFA